MTTKKLQIITPIVTSVNGETGDITMNSVEYTPQTLTDAQKAQARENIGAEEMYGGLRKVTLTCNKVIGTGTQDFTIYVSSGSIEQYGDDASDEIKNAFLNLYRWFNFGRGFSSISVNPSLQNNVKSFYEIYKEGLMTVPFTAVSDYMDPTTRMRCWATSKEFQVSMNFLGGSSCTYVYDFVNDKFTANEFNLSPGYAYTNDASTQNPAYNQFKMHTNPTDSMEVATKKYVDNSTTTITVKTWTSSDIT